MPRSPGSGSAANWAGKLEQSAPEPQLRGFFPVAGPRGGRKQVSGSQGFWSFSIEIVIPQILFAMKWTLLLLATSATLGTLVGLAAALMRIARTGPLRWLAGTYVTIWRGTPLLLQVLFIYNGLPMIYEKFNVIDSFTAATLALGLNAGAYIAEIIRAAVQSIDRGQMEAARSLGLSHGQALRTVILPQTFRRLIPPMVNELAALSKDTSLAMVASLQEVMRTGAHLASKYFRPVEAYLWVALAYLSITLALTALANHYEQRLEAKE